MQILDWPLPEVTNHRHSPTYEWAAIKTHCESHSNEETRRIYTEMFGDEPKKGVPYWLVRVAIYYGALSLGYSRVKKKLPSIEAAMLACVSKLNVNDLRNNIVLIRHLRANDFEDAALGGCELTE